MTQKENLQLQNMFVRILLRSIQQLALQFLYGQLGIEWKTLGKVNKQDTFYR